MLGTIPGYSNGKIYSYGAFCGQEPEVIVAGRIERMKPQVSKEMQEVHEELLKKYSLAHGTPDKKG